MLEGYDGTWQDRPGRDSAARSACGGRKVPLTVQSSSRTLLAFTVWGETVAPACPTLTIAVKPTSDKLLKASADAGSHASESPEVHASHAFGTPAAAASSPGGGERGSARGLGRLDPPDPSLTA